MKISSDVNDGEKRVRVCYDSRIIFPLRIEMPCGAVGIVEGPPLQDWKCSCGDPTHWFVKIERVVQLGVLCLKKEG